MTTELLAFCAGNAEAADWLARWRLYVHAIDDQVDDDVPPVERVEHLLRTFAAASELYTHPFFVRHALSLQLLVALVTSAYADTVAFERSDTPWKRAWADHYRHIGAEMALAVAYLCGGYNHLRAVSPDMRSSCHWLHQDPDGKPV